MVSSDGAVTHIVFCTKCPFRRYRLGVAAWRHRGPCRLRTQVSQRIGPLCCLPQPRHHHKLHKEIRTSVGAKEAEAEAEAAIHSPWCRGTGVDCSMLSNSHPRATSGVLLTVKPGPRARPSWSGTSLGLPRVSSTCSGPPGTAMRTSKSLWGPVVRRHEEYHLVNFRESSAADHRRRQSTDLERRS